MNNIFYLIGCGDKKRYVSVEEVLNNEEVYRKIPIHYSSKKFFVSVYDDALCNLVVEA